MLFKKSLSLAVLAGLVSVVVPMTAMAEVDSYAILDEAENAYIVTRDLEVGQTQTGTLDLTRLKVVGPPMKLELTIDNPSSNPVQVIIPAIESSFLVPANSQRVHYFSPLQVGEHTEVSYSVTPILTPVTKPLDISSIAYILDPSYTQMSWQEEYKRREEAFQPVRPTTTSSGTVRGYW